MWGERMSLKRKLEELLFIHQDVDQAEAEIRKWVLEQIKFCGECKWLLPVEHDQTKAKEPHTCTAFRKRVYHGNNHPEILRCDDCVDLIRKKLGGEGKQWEIIQHKTI